MTERDIMPPEMKQAYEEIPRKWYEADTFIGYYPRVIVTYFAASQLYDQLTEDRSMYTKLAVLAFYTLSLVADGYSTIRGMHADEKLRGQGIESGFSELNPFIGPVKTQREFVRSPVAWAMAVVPLPLVILDPIIGVGVTAVRGYTAVLNIRSVKRLERALEIVKEKQGGDVTDQAFSDSRG